MGLEQRIKTFIRNRKRLESDQDYRKNYALASDCYFLEDGSILSYPRDDGDSRYPYGENGFNFWTSASGYMHCNEGLFSPFLRATEGQEPKIAFFAKIEGELVSLLSVPLLGGVNDKAIRYTIFTMGATYYICETHGLIFALRIGVDAKKRLLISLEVDAADEEAQSGGARDIQIAYYLNPFIKNALVENSVDRWFRRSTFIDEGALGHFVVEAYEEVDRKKMAANKGFFYLTANEGTLSQLKKKEITTSRYQFVGGARSSLHTPKALYEGTFGEGQRICSFTETGIIAYLLTFTMTKPLRLEGQFCFEKPEYDVGDEEIEDEERIQEADERIEINKMTEMSEKSVDDYFETLELREQAKLGDLKLEFNQGLVLNAFFEQVKKQVEFCSTIKGYIQLSSFSLIGIRDVFQAIEALLYYEPQVAKAKMLEALNFVTQKGRCPRQYILPNAPKEVHAMDLRPFIDQGVWVISTIVAYIKQTKDIAFLSETAGYYKFIDESRHLACADEASGSVLEHLIKMMNYLIEQRDPVTKCVLALYGDWNDALDGLGKSLDPSKEYGTGVSVMATLQVYQNLGEMMDLLKHLQQLNTWPIASSESLEMGHLINQYQQVKDEIAQGLKTHAVVTHPEKGLKLLHGWGDAQSYCVGGFEDVDGIERDGLTSQAFWILSGLLEQEYHEIEREIVKDSIRAAYQRLSGPYGFKTFWPGFEMDAEGVGRIPNLPIGTAENGAAYIHASLFGIMSLFKIGESQWAWEELFKVMPLTHNKISCSPFVMPNSYGENKELHIDGESMSDWQTGSSNVLIKTLLRYVIGYEPELSRLIIQPARYCPYESIKASVIYKGIKINMHIDFSPQKRQFFVNEQPMDGTFDEHKQLTVLHLSDPWFDKYPDKTLDIQVIGCE